MSTRVQVNTGSGTTPVLASFTNTPTQGNLLVCCARGTTTIGNASLPVGWEKDVSALMAPTQTIGIWSKVAGAGESKDVTVTWTDSTSTTVIILEYASTLLNPVLDKVANTDTTGGTVTSRSSGTTPTISSPTEICIAFIGLGNTVSSESWSNSFVTDYRNSPTPVVVVARWDSSVTQAVETTLSWTTARLAGGCIATFMSAPSSWVPKVIFII